MSDQALPPRATEAGLAAANLPDGPHPATPHVEVPAGGSGVPIDPALEELSAPVAPAAPAAETAATNTSDDVTMTDAAPTPLPASAVPAQAQSHSNAPSPLPARVSTPIRNAASSAANGEGGERSRAASAHPDSAFTMPTEAPVHGAPVRQYLNTKVTGVLLEGMKIIAKDQPKDPLRVLGEYLIMKSKELENQA